MRARNFNIVPTALLNMRDQYVVINSNCGSRWRSGSCKCS
ncbi:MAG: 5-oxoproline transporter, DUF979 family subunit [Pyrinomonadaceae bacterium]